MPKWWLCFLLYCNKMRIFYFMEDLPYTIAAEYGSNWHSSFRGKAYFSILAIQKQAMFFVWSKWNENFLDITIYIILVKFGFIGKVVSEEKICLHIEQSKARIPKSVKTKWDIFIFPWFFMSCFIHQSI